MGVIHWLLAEAMAVIGFICAIVLVPRIIMERRQVGATLAWVLIICLVPYVGVPLFFLIGGRKVKRVTARKVRPVLESGHGAAAVPALVSEKAWNVAALMTRAGALPPRTGNRLQTITDGQQAYEAIMQMLDTARERIEVCTYILGRDDVGRAIVRKLAQKAADDIQVRLLVDGLGSFSTRGRFLRQFRNAGGRAATFLPVMPFRRKASANLRNHRKIIVVDNRFAIVGGMNLSSEFIGPPSRRRRWRDVCIRIEGPVALDLHDVFDADWAFATGKGSEPSSKEDLLAPAADSAQQGSAIIQIAPDGPDMAQKPIYSGVMAALSQAEKRIWIVTPFFVPDEAFATTLTLAARMGRDVRLIIPRRSNMPLVDLAGRSYLDALMSAGGRVFLFKKGLLHAKLLVVDESLACVGSFNVDVRSFHLDFEIGAFLYGREDVRQIAGTVSALQQECELLDPQKFAGRNRARRFIEDMCRLFSPLL